MNEIPPQKKLFKRFSSTFKKQFVCVKIVAFFFIHRFSLYNFLFHFVLFEFFIMHTKGKFEFLFLCEHSVQNCLVLIQPPLSSQPQMIFQPQWSSAQSPSVDQIFLTLLSSCVPNEVCIQTALIHHTHPVLEISSIINTHTCMQLYPSSFLLRGCGVDCCLQISRLSTSNIYVEMIPATH